LFLWHESCRWVFVNKSTRRFLNVVCDQNSHIQSCELEMGILLVVFNSGTTNIDI